MLVFSAMLLGRHPISNPYAEERPGRCFISSVRDDKFLYVIPNGSHRLSWLGNMSYGWTNIYPDCHPKGLFTHCLWEALQQVRFGSNSQMSSFIGQRGWFLLVIIICLVFIMLASHLDWIERNSCETSAVFFFSDS